MQVYINGSWKNLSNAGASYWSATTLSFSTELAWNVYTPYGYVIYFNKTNTYDSRCVRP